MPLLVLAFALLLCFAGGVRLRAGTSTSIGESAANDYGLDSEAAAIFAKYSKGGLGLLDTSSSTAESSNGGDEDIIDTPEISDTPYEVEADKHRKKLEGAVENLADKFAGIATAAGAAIGSAGAKALAAKPAPQNATEQQMDAWRAENAQRIEESQSVAAEAMQSALNKGLSAVRQTARKPEVAEALEPLRNSGLETQVRQTGVRFTEIADETLNRALKTQKAVQEHPELLDSVLKAQDTVQKLRSDLEKGDDTLLSESVAS